jgi:glycosyltransferase involved in cell wall biosynthesis
MKRIRFAIDMPHNGAFVGGVATMINKYIEHKEEFAKCGYSPDIIDLSKYNIRFKHLKKLSNIVSMFRQATGVVYEIKKDPKVDIHIQSSLKWTLAKDLFIITRTHKKLLGKMCLTIHHAVPDNFFYGKIGEKIGIYIINKYVDKLVVLSELTRDYFLSKGTEKDKMLVLYTFHDMVDVPYEKAIISEPNLVFMGAINRWKGIFELIAAIKQAEKQTIILNVCGQFPSEKEKEEFNKAIQGIEKRVKIHGYVVGEDKKNILTNNAIFVLPSHAEGMPLSILEAMACGCAIISTNVGSIPEVISEKNGILIEPYDIDGLTCAINHMEGFEKERKEMQVINYHYSIEFYISNHIKVLSNFLLV